MTDQPNEPSTPNEPAAPREPAAPKEPSAERTPADAVSVEQRQWAFFAHLSAFAGLVIPLGNLLGPLIIWQLKKHDMPFVADQAKEALNFQITVTIALLASFMLFFLLIGFVLMPLVALAAIILTIIAAIKANAGEQYRYPYTLRLVN